MSRNQSKSWLPCFFAGVLILLVVVVGVASLGGFLWWKQALKPVDLGSDTVVRMVVAKGSGVNQIASQLQAAHLVKSELAFKLMVKKLGIEKQIQAGSFELSAAQNTEEIATALTKGSNDVWVTILEGWRREEVAAAIQKALATKEAEFDMTAFLEATENSEGFLFPDTYLIPLAITPEGVADLLTRTFEQKITEQMKKDAVQAGTSMAEIVTMASLIEREAKSDEARKLVSGILWKRLANDWPLQVDATLQYARGFDAARQDWWSEPTAAMKEINSPYNTYKNLGLPPGPIASPSLSSIEAAIYPTESEYWYYLTDLEGRMHYGRTLEEHNQNVEEYLK